MAVDVFLDGGKANTTAALLAWATPPKFGAWGTGNGASQTSTATALVTPAAPTTTTAVTGTPTQQTTTVTNDTWQVVTTITAGGTLAITEFILTTNATIASGTAHQYHFFTVINLLNGDSITFTSKLKYS